MAAAILASLIAERVKSCMAGVIGASASSFAVQELAAGCGAKAIFNETSAVEESGEEAKSLGDQIYRLRRISVSTIDELTKMRRVTLGISQVQKWLAAFQSSAYTKLDRMYDIELGLCKEISTAGNKMTMRTSSMGGFDIEIGSYTVHVPKYASVHHPLIQMVLFARTLYDSTLRCLKLVAAQSIVEFNAASIGITKTKAHSPNTVSARKDVHVLADTAPENYSITPGMDKNIPKLGELDYNVDLSTVPVQHSGGFAPENVYNLHSLTSAPSSADHGITKAEDDTEHWRLTNVAKAVDKTDVTWVLATAAVHHATGNRDLLSGFTTMKELFVKAGDGVSMPVCGRGSVITGKVVLQDVWFVPGLTENLVSVAQLTDLDYNVGFARGDCIIKGATDGIVIGKAHVSQDRSFEVDFLKVGPVI